jgi:GNAT superfamily N-acetyltransferase
VTTVATLGQVSLSEDLIGGGLALSTEAGWNQVDADWRFMIASGTGFGFVAPDGRLVASGLTVDFERYAWISMILVTPEWQRKGLATRLMGDCVDILRSRGLVPALDASPQGREVYRKIGFRDGETLTRLVGDLSDMPGPTDGPAVRAMTAEHLAEIAAFDARSSGTDRKVLLAHLRGRMPRAALAARRNGRLAGFVLARDGRTCSQIGPLVADDDETAAALLAAAGRAVGGPVCFDLFDHRPVLRSLLDRHGMRPVTRFIRMVQGTEDIFPPGHGVHIIAGPELS